MRELSLLLSMMACAAPDSKQSTSILFPFARNSLRCTPISVISIRGGCEATERQSSAERNSALLMPETLKHLTSVQPRPDSSSGGLPDEEIFLLGSDDPELIKTLKASLSGNVSAEEIIPDDRNCSSEQRALNEQLMQAASAGNVTAVSNLVAMGAEVVPSASAQ